LNLVDHLSEVLAENDGVGFGDRYGHWLSSEVDSFQPRRNRCPSAGRLEGAADRFLAKSSLQIIATAQKLGIDPYWARNNGPNTELKHYGPGRINDFRSAQAIAWPELFHIDPAPTTIVVDIYDKLRIRFGHDDGTG